MNASSLAKDLELLRNELSSSRQQSDDLQQETDRLKDLYEETKK